MLLKENCMYKIITIDVGNTEEKEREDYNIAEVKLNELENEGWKVISTCWDTGGVVGGQTSGVVVFLHK